MVQFKIFWGQGQEHSSDAQLNEWLKENPDVEIIDWQYQMSRYGYHSICIRYKERGESDV